MNDMPSAIERILDLDITVQRQIYAGWPASWCEVKWPVGAIRALLIVERGYASTPAEVAAILKVSRTRVTGMLDRLEGDGLITRRVDPLDRRSFVLELTEAGRATVRQIDDLRRLQVREALSRMDVNDIAALRQGLEALTQALETGLRRHPVEEPVVSD